jgi:hypothetical protein
MTALADRLARIDAAILCHRHAFLAAAWAEHEGERTYHRDEVDRLLDLRVRVERGHGQMTVFVPERASE